MESVTSVLIVGQQLVVHNMIISYYGDGKGKTTAALGLALRASGYEKKILFAQFIKSPQSTTGEDRALKKIKFLEHKKFGLGFIGIKGDQRKFSEHSSAAQKGLEYVNSSIDAFDIVILDEIFGAIKGNLISSEQVLSMIKNSKKIVVLTGRPAIDSILKVSDLVTHMQNIKHPFDSGSLAAEAVDY